MNESLHETALRSFDSEEQKCPVSMEALRSVSPPPKDKYSHNGMEKDHESHRGTGVEAEPIGNSGTVIFTMASSPKKKNENRSASLPPRLSSVPSSPLEIRSPIVGSMPRNVCEMSPCDAKININHLTNPNDDGLFQRAPMFPTQTSTPTTKKDASTPTLEQLLDRLEIGVPLIFHDATNTAGTQIILSVLDDHSYIAVSPNPNFPSPPSSQLSAANRYLPIMDIKYLDVGKKNSPVLSKPILSHINPMLCFSVVSSTGSTLDFEARSILERETIVSSLSLILDEVHHAELIANNVSSTDIVDIEMDMPVLDENGPSFHPSEERRSSFNSSDLSQPFPVQQHQQQPPATPSVPNKTKEARSFKSKASNTILSPNNRTYIYNRTPRTNEEGTEISLARRESSTDVTDAATTPYSNPSLPDFEGNSSENNTGFVNQKQTQSASLILHLDDEDTDINKTCCSQWCSQFCAEVCTDLLNSIDNFDPQNCSMSLCPIPPPPCLDCFDFEELQAERKLIQSSVEHILGSSSRTAASWFEGHVWTLEAVCTDKNKAIEAEKVQQILRNRASLLNAQARRLRRLRNEMTFINAVKSASQQMRWVQTTHSVDDADKESSNDGASLSGFTSGINSGIDGNLSSAFRESTTLSSSFTGSKSSQSTRFLREFLSISTSFTNQDQDHLQLFYDSDPGEVKYRVSRKSSRRAVIEQMNAVVENQVWVSNEFSTVRNAARKNRKFVKKKSNGKGGAVDKKQTEFASTKPTLFEDELTSKFMQEITNGSMTLVWHPSQNEQNKNLSPICVKAWIELGSRLRDTFVQPKLMWRAVYEPHLQRKKLSISGKTPFSVDLLDICRILDVTKINRDVHPFAKKSCSFTVETNSEVFLFESIGVEERDRIVHGMKMLVARMASKLIVGDTTVYDEFFSPTGQVPGEPPEWVLHGLNIEN